MVADWVWKKFVPDPGNSASGKTTRPVPVGGIVLLTTFEYGIGRFPPFLRAIYPYRATWCDAFFRLIPIVFLWDYPKFGPLGWGCLSPTPEQSAALQKTVDRLRAARR